MTKKQVSKLLPLLQCVMRIQDWDVSIEDKTGLEMVNLVGQDDCMMYVVADRNHRQATVFVNKECIENSIDEGYYKNLVHELHHIKLDGLIHVVDHALMMIPEDIRPNIAGLISTKTEELINMLTKTFVDVYPLDTSMLK